MTAGSENVCPQCGAAVEVGESCPACGAPLVVEESCWEQPALETPGGGIRFGALGTTAISLAVRPRESFARFRWRGNYLAPAVFAVLLGGPAVGLGYLAEVYLSVGRVRGQVSGWQFLGLVVAAPLLYLYVRAHLVHLVLVVLGAVRRPFAATYRAVFYSGGAVGLSWLMPFVGGAIFLVWETWLEATALREAHRLPLGRAVAVVLLPSVALAVVFLARATLEFLVR